MVSLNRRKGLFGQVSAEDDFTTAEDQPVDFSAGLTSLGFIGGAIRRGVWFWGAMALAGVLLSVGLSMFSPSTYQARTTLVLKVGPESAPGAAIANDQVVAQSRPVAALALKKMGLQEDASSFAQSYTVSVLSDQALKITVNAPSSSDAVTQARAVAAAFLQLRASELQSLQQGYFKGLDQAAFRQRQLITALSTQIKKVSAQPPSPAQQARLSFLQSQRGSAVSTLTTMTQSFGTDKAATAQTTAQQIQESKVVDPAAPVLQSRHARLKHLIFSALLGLIVGLTLGLGIVIVRALVSDRLRRRDDVAYALGAPVKLSVGAVEPKRWLPGRRGLAALEDRDVQRIAAYLRRAIRRSSQGFAALAIVSVDSTQAAALSVVSLAVSCAERGQRVVIADIAPGSPAASLMDTAEPGVRMVNVEGKQLVVAVPEPGDDVPCGPLDRASRQAQPALDRAVKSADLLLTLVILDPSLGAEHIATWTTDAVVMLTAGRSSWTKIHAVGEMIRLAGTRLVSAILVGADKTDESLGVTHTGGSGRNSGMADDSLHTEDEPSAASTGLRRE
jgi:capsular polysaccharide biosynthesis protein